MLSWSATANPLLSGEVLDECSDGGPSPSYPCLQQLAGSACGGGGAGGPRYGGSVEVQGGLQPASPLLPPHPGGGEGGGGDAGACQVAPG